MVNHNLLRVMLYGGLSEIIEFFVLKPILSDMAILCRLGKVIRLS